VVYSDVVGRTQIYLGDEELELLDRAAATTGASRSELIRRAVRDSYGERSTTEKMRALRESAGSWRGRRQTGAEYVDARRGDLGARLRRLGLE
jgi:Arc/MetJ-type ribon-helix-helix transcriptional regulator